MESGGRAWIPISKINHHFDIFFLMMEQNYYYSSLHPSQPNLSDNVGTSNERQIRATFDSNLQFVAINFDTHKIVWVWIFLGQKKLYKYHIKKLESQWYHLAWSPNAYANDGGKRASSTVHSTNNFQFVLSIVECNWSCTNTIQQYTEIRNEERKSQNGLI